jgi:molybdate-binding protein/transcriptional regulator with XRE-family HTH domain
MAKLPELENTLRDQRVRRGWSQEELARRSGLSRAGVSAIETSRLVPSAAAALALAAALGCRVEDVFRLPRAEPEGAQWAWPPRLEPCRYWHAEVSGRTRLYPVEASSLGLIPHDGIARGGVPEDQGRIRPEQTLVMASCDPAVGLLAGELARTAGFRLIVVPRSSRAALELLEQGLIHVAGIHLAAAGASGGNAEVVRRTIGTGYQLLHVARWDEGIAFAPAQRITSIRDAVRADLRWIGREVGSGARQCIDELLGSRHRPRRVASDHRGVTESIRCGWADVGVCLRLSSVEAGLEFLSVRQEAYDLCFPEALKADPRIVALVEAVRSSPYRRLLGELPGYDTTDAGSVQRLR